MNGRTPITSATARLLSWDATCLPTIVDIGGEADPAAVRCDSPGAGLATVARWPRGQRAAVALQVAAAAAFLFARGWYPSRGLLRGGRVERGAGGPWYRLGRLPRRRLDDGSLERRFGLALESEEAVLAASVLPLLRGLLPERAEDLERVTRARPAWEATGAWLALLLADGRGASALRHAAGAGRALWARRAATPLSGVWWVEEGALLQGAATAARLSAAGRPLYVVGGALEEGDVVRARAHAAALGRDVVVFTSLSLPGVPALPLAEGVDSVWVAAPRPEMAHAHASAAVQAGGHRPSVARIVLEDGAAGGFAQPPRPSAPLLERERLASPPARLVLAWIASAPVGLTVPEVDLLVEGGGEAVAELERLGLLHVRRGVCRAAKPAATPSAEKLAAMAERLPRESAAGVVARALTGPAWQDAARWCEARLQDGSAREALAVAEAASSIPAMRIVAAEAALALGRLAEADRFLEGTPVADRDGRWHALAAWWAEQSGASERVGVELAAVHGALPGRLAARVAMVTARLACRRGARGEAQEVLERAVAATSPPLVEAEIELAACRGAGPLRDTARRRGARWTGDDTAGLLHLQGLAALDRGRYAVAMTAMRAALRAASGDNPRLLGEIHADLACGALLAQQPAGADRHLTMAEELLERCGSRRAATVVRANRAVLADDRLDWRAARELALTGRGLRGAVDDAGTWLFELELARSDLARGDAAAAGAQLPRLAEGVARIPDQPMLTQALASLRAHLALASGDLAGALAAACDAEAGERELVLILADAEAGRDPPGTLVRRWGMTVTAQLLAAWRRGDGSTALARVEYALERAPREAAVGLARFAALLARRDERLGPEWDDGLRRAEAVLAEAELDGWLRLLRGASAADPVRVVRALDGIVNAGTDGLNAARLASLAHALDLPWLLVERDGKIVGGCGEPDGPGRDVVAAGVRVRTGGAGSGLARSALEMLARSVAARPEATVSEPGPGGGGLLGESRALAEVREQVARWGPLPLTVLITGEPGTGKELVARELHRSSRRAGAFVPVNCAGIPAALLEAELFGVIRGAFTGADRDRPGLVEAAEAGTLFFDEIGELPLELQGKLLRLLQEHEVRRVGATRARTVEVRFVAATNCDLKRAAAGGRFRQDLYYRVAVAVIEVPPLRARPDDIDLLARHFAARFAGLLGRPGVRLAPAAVELLRCAEWPGNVRELESAVARAVATARPGEVLGPDRFADLVPAPAASGTLPAWSAAAAAFRRGYFQAILREAAGNRSQAARRAGISRQTLLYHLRELGIGHQGPD